MHIFHIFSSMSGTSNKLGPVVLTNSMNFSNSFKSVIQSMRLNIACQQKKLASWWRGQKYFFLQLPSKPKKIWPSWLKVKILRRRRRWQQLSGLLHMLKIEPKPINNFDRCKVVTMQFILVIENAITLTYLKLQLRNIQLLRERTEHLDIFLFLPITQWCSISDVLFTGGREVSDFSVLKYY